MKAGREEIFTSWEMEITHFGYFCLKEIGHICILTKVEGVVPQQTSNLTAK